MAESLYSSVPSTEPSPSSARPSPSPLVERFNSLSSWTNPFLSRFPSLASTTFSGLRRGLSSVSSVRTVPISSSTSHQNEGSRYDSIQKREEDGAEEATVGFASSTPAATGTDLERPTATKTPATMTTSGSNISADPFDDSNAATKAPPPGALPLKPLWHRAIVAGTILCALLGLGLGLGLGIKKITNKVGEIESDRIEASLSSAAAASSSATSTKPVPPSTTTMKSPSSSSSSSSDATRSNASSPSTTTRITFSSLASDSSRAIPTPPHPSTIPVTTDVLWAVPKTAPAAKAK